MDVFGVAVTAGGALMRDAAIEAAYDLGVFEALAATPALTLAELCRAIGVDARHRMRALLDALVAWGVIARQGVRFVVAALPDRPVVARSGWGLLADVIRTDRPLPPEGGETQLRYHQHLLQAGAAAARELTAEIAGDALLDLGGGAGAYTAAFLDQHPDARATLVDAPDVIELAKVELARFGARVTFVAGDARDAAIGDGYDAALLANVLHLHSQDTCAALCEVAARAVAPGGVVVIKDLLVEEDRSGPLEGLLFALNMAIYTDAGDVYEASRVRRWLAASGLVAIEQRRLAATPEGLVILGQRPA